MSTESDVKTARYRKTEKQADKFGRIIGVRRLKPSEQSKIAGMTTDLAGSDEVMVANPETHEEIKVLIPHRAPLLLAASVCLISDDQGDMPVSFPRTRAELDAIYDRLDVEGLIAAGEAMVRLNADEADDPVAEAKN